MNFITRFLKQVLEDDRDEVLTSFYGIKFPIDEEEVKRRQEKVETLKKQLGHKYLLSNSVKRKTGVK
jgi:hypothetical protein